MSLNKASQFNRRHFLRAAGGGVAAATLPWPGLLFARDRELVIDKILIQEAKGRRLAPVAPNAYAPYRGYDCAESVLRIQTAQGIEGVCQAGWGLKPESLKKLIGLDPFKLFQFGANDRIVGPAEQYGALLEEIHSVDVALIDLIGKALKRPAAALLGDSVRDTVQAYDGSVYMEDLLKSAERKDLVFVKGAMPSDPVELTVRKALWVVNERPEGFKAFKIKIGRGKWMGSLQEALKRDIEVTNAIRKAVGPDIKLMVDGNRGYWGVPQMASDYAQGVAASNVYFLEEMFPEEDIPNMHEFKRRLRGARNPAKLAAGESNRGGVAEEIYTHRVDLFNGEEPLIDVEQADMNAHGFLYLREKAAKQAALGMTMAPHNFSSKLGFYAQVHLGTVTPNWDISEVDDATYPAIIAEGVELKQGFGRLTGAPGLGVTLRAQHLQQPKLEL